MIAVGVDITVRFSTDIKDRQNSIWNRKGMEEVKLPSSEGLCAKFRMQEDDAQACLNDSNIVSGHVKESWAVGSFSG